MLEAIFIGIGLGLSTLVFIGPVLFYILKSSVENGRQAGYQVALGIITGDVIYVILVLNGLGSYVAQSGVQKNLALVGGAILLFLGIKNLFSKNLSTEVREKIKNKSSWSFFANGFLINFINPFVVVVWIGFMSLLQSKFDNEIEIHFALLSCLLIILTTDLLKAFYSEKLKKIITDKKLIQMNFWFGILMICFSLRLFYQYFQF